jgi:hypothetical protein
MATDELPQLVKAASVFGSQRLKLVFEASDPVDQGRLTKLDLGLIDLLVGRILKPPGGKVRRQDPVVMHANGTSTRLLELIFDASGSVEQGLLSDDG